MNMHQVSGRVIHIDFGDCFEVTKNRKDLPEIIPFRLTRMLTACMGASGIEGTYKATAYRVMRVLRDNRDSVMAMLEAFVYDPMISWRVLAQATNANPNHQQAASSANKDAGEPAAGSSSSMKGGSLPPISPVDLVREDLTTHLGLRLEEPIGFDPEGGDGEGGIRRSFSLGVAAGAGMGPSHPDRLDFGLAGGGLSGVDTGILRDDSRRSPRPDDSSPLHLRALGGDDDLYLDQSDHDNAGHGVPSTMVEKRLFNNPPHEEVLAEPDEPMRENINARALEIINRIHAKVCVFSYPYIRNDDVFFLYAFTSDRYYRYTQL